MNGYIFPIIVIILIVIAIIFINVFPPKYQLSGDINPKYVEKEDVLKPKLKEDERKDGKRFLSKGERLCKEILEEKFGMKILPFNPESESFRPDWLKNPKTKKNLELDMYNPYMRVALEYQGKQHYVVDGNMTKNSKELEYTKYKDQLKVDKCKEMGINLIVVPYTVDEKFKTDEEKREALKKYIEERL